MSTKIIELISDVVQKTGLEVYRDISLNADLNQANILKTYRKVVPMAYLANNIITCYIDKPVVNLDTFSVSYEKYDHLSDIFLNPVNKNIDFTYKRGQYTVFTNHEGSNVLSGNFDGLDLSINWKCQFLSDISVKNIQSTDLYIYDYPTDVNDLTNLMLEGEISAKNIVKKGFLINAQISDTYYEEVYGDTIENYIQFLRAEMSNNSNEVSAIITEQSVKTVNELLLLLKDEGQISSFNNWKELQHWNPYKLAKLVNVKSIFNSLHNIFEWTPGERILNPEFGSNLRKLLYNGITNFTSESIIAEIRRCISEYEPRVYVQNIVNASNMSDIENNTIQIDIVFTIPSLSREQFVYSYKYNQYDK